MEANEEVKENCNETDNEKLLSEKENDKQTKTRRFQRKYIISFILKLLFMIFILWVMFYKIFGIYAVKNNDMQPKIMAGDLTFYYRLDKSYKSSNVVVYKVDGKKYVGRIVAIGGDTVEITEEGKLIINGDTMIESDIYYQTTAYDGDSDTVKYPMKLQKNTFFILGDYREGAKDSRYFGAIPVEQIEGEVITVIRRGGI